MPDHIAEFMSPGMPPASTVIVGERGETGLDAARAQLLDYYRGGLLASEGARITVDGPLSGAQVSGVLMTMRWGPKSTGRIETVALLAFQGQRIVEVVASHPEGDIKAERAVLALVRSMRCK